MWVHMQVREGRVVSGDLQELLTGVIGELCFPEADFSFGVAEMLWI